MSSKTNKRRPSVENYDISGLNVRPFAKKQNDVFDKNTKINILIF